MQGFCKPNPKYPFIGTKRSNRYGVIPKKAYEFNNIIMVTYAVAIIYKEYLKGVIRLIM